MFDWLFGVRKKLQISVDQGRRGKWRLEISDGDDVILIGVASGYDTAAQALEVADMIAKAQIKVKR